MVLGHYSPSSSPTKKTPDTTAKTSNTSPTALLTGTTKPKPMASSVAHINADCRNQRGLHHLLSPLSNTLLVSSRYAAKTRSAFRGRRGEKPSFAHTALIVVRHLFTDQIETRALSSASLQLWKTIPS